MVFTLLVLLLVLLLLLLASSSDNFFQSWELMVQRQDMKQRVMSMGQTGIIAFVNSSLQLRASDRREL